jgi:hypothetical protein
MEYRRCAACEQVFRPRAQVPQQRFCGKAACQGERRRRWQQGKRRGDEDYRANQAHAQRTWGDGHRDYWCEWRATHPAYTERNRLEQRRRDRQRHASRLAKMDASTPVRPIPSGTYRLVPWTDGDLAKMDACTVKLTLISDGYGRDADAGAILQREDVIGAREPPC